MKQRVPKANIDSFLGDKSIAVAGVSRSGKKFGNAVFKELKERGYTVYPLNPQAREINGEQCFPKPSSLPKGVGGLVLVVPPEQTAQLLDDALKAGIRKIWFQPGSESAEGKAFCERNGLTAVSGECILMHGEHVGSIHGVHRFFRRLFGTMPV